MLSISLLILVFGGGGGYWAHRHYGPGGLGVVFAVVLLGLLAGWWIWQS